MNAGIPLCKGLNFCSQANISYSAARQLFVYTKNMSSRKCHTYKSKTLKCWCLSGAVPNCMHEAQHTGCIMHTWLHACRYSHACKYTGQCNTLQLSCSFCLPKQNQSVHVHIPSLLRPRPKLLRFDALVSDIYGKALSHQHSFTAKLKKYSDFKLKEWHHTI